TWYGTPGKTTLGVDEWAHDTCGAVTRHESVWGDNPPRIQDYTFDDQGRVISQSTTQFDQAPTTVHYAYDTEGRLTQFGDQHYTFDAEGRLSTVTNHNELQFSWPDEDPAADAITFHYECTPAP
ncbi:MAG: YD repeat-containing protein, partial [Myxococcota bacterium]